MNRSRTLNDFQGQLTVLEHTLKLRTSFCRVLHNLHTYFCVFNYVDMIDTSIAIWWTATSLSEGQCSLYLYFLTDICFSRP